MQKNNDFNEFDIKHLEFIQSVIIRMNTNSFQIKSWCVAIVSALLAVSASSKDVLFILVAIIPVIIFWFLDAYYLMQERKFRGLYNDVSKITHHAKLALFEMNPSYYKSGKYHYCNVLKSVTMVLMYGVLILLLFVLYFILAH